MGYSDVKYLTLGLRLKDTYLRRPGVSVIFCNASVAVLLLRAMSNIDWVGLRRGLIGEWDPRSSIWSSFSTSIPLIEVVSGFSTTDEGASVMSEGVESGVYSGVCGFISTSCGFPSCAVFTSFITGGSYSFLVSTVFFNDIYSS